MYYVDTINYLDISVCMKVLCVGSQIKQGVCVICPIVIDMNIDGFVRMRYSESMSQRLIVPSVKRSCIVVVISGKVILVEDDVGERERTDQEEGNNYLIVSWLYRF